MAVQSPETCSTRVFHFSIASSLCPLIDAKHLMHSTLPEPSSPDWSSSFQGAYSNQASDPQNGQCFISGVVSVVMLILFPCDCFLVGGSRVQQSLPYAGNLRVCFPEPGAWSLRAQLMVVECRHKSESFRATSRHAHPAIPSRLNPSTRLVPCAVCRLAPSRPRCSPEKQKPLGFLALHAATCLGFPESQNRRGLVCPCCRIDSCHCTTDCPDHKTQHGLMWGVPII